MTIPAYLTRYSHPDDDPFLSLNDLPHEEANSIKRQHCRRNNIGGFYAQDDYLLHRREVERWIATQLLQKGGRAEDAVPLYMTLGVSTEGEFDIRQDIQSNHIEILVPLTELDLQTVSFTYPDSMYELRVDAHGNVIGGERTNTPAVYMYHELAELYAKYRVHDPYSHYVEAQIWDRKPLYRLWQLLSF